MKKKNKILIIIMILAVAVFAFTIYSVATNKKEKTEEIEMSETMANLYSKLKEEGDILYANNDYLEFDKRNDVYFISLEELNIIYDYDISIFVDENNNVCDANASGIYFDVDNKLVQNADDYVIASLAGCGDEVENNTLTEEDKTITLDSDYYMQSISPEIIAIFAYEDDKITNYYEYFEIGDVPFEVFKDMYITEEYVKEITELKAYFVIEYDLEYVLETYYIDTLSGIKAYFGE